MPPMPASAPHHTQESRDHPGAGHPARCADNPLGHLFPGPAPLEIVILVVLVLIPLTFALLIVFYLKLARFREKPSTFSIRG